MKKLLTILVVALTLCLLCGVALADKVELSGKAYTDAQQAVLAHGPADITVTYKDTTLTLYYINGGENQKCLEDRVLHFEGNYMGTTVFFDAVYVKPHNVDTTVVGTVEKKRTCTTNAVMSTICPDCKQKVEYTYTGTDAAYKKSGHTWETGDPDAEVITTAPTCESKGVWEYYCGNGCGTKNPDKGPQVIDEVGHDFVYSWVKEPTCISKGTVTYNCRHCGIEWNEFLKNGSAAAAKITSFRKNEVKDILGTQYTVEAALAESRITWQQSAWNLTGKYVGWGDVAHKNYMGHDFDEFVPYEAATCFNPSTYIRWCPVCGEKQILDSWEVKGVWDQLEPKYEMISKVRDGSCDQVVVTFRCALCKGNKGPHGEAPIHTDIKVTMKDKARLDTCNTLSKYEYELVGLDPKEVLSIDAHEYELKDAYKIGTFKPTCTLEGYTAYMCKWDTINAPTDYTIKADGTISIPSKGHPVKKVDVKSALGHKWIGDGDGWVMKYAPGEYDNVNGYWLRTCSVCGKTENRISPFYPNACEEHKFEVVSEKPASCEADGEKVEKCTVCGEEKTTVIPATGHALNTLVKSIKEATCTEAGEGLFLCDNCGLNIKVAIEAKGHTWDEGKITKEATKEAKGEKTFTCKRCGETKKEDVEYVITADPKYSVTALAYNGKTVTGKLVHDEDTLVATNINVRVTFFIEGNYYMATIGEVAADGSFSVDGVGPIEYISVVATGSSSVNPDDVVALGSGEITVK